MTIEALSESPILPSPIRLSSVGELAGHVGQELGVSDWLLIDQQRIDRFAEATDDRQWIHVDPVRARDGMPQGRTIAHGFLLVSLLAPLFETTILIGGTASSINYGFNRLRFTAPVSSGTHIRARFTLGGYEPVANGAQLTWSVTVERQAEDRPALVAEWLMRRYAEPDARS